jgi:mono/diheme cytochrome c family protein
LAEGAAIVVSLSVALSSALGSIMALEDGVEAPKRSGRRVPKRTDASIARPIQIFRRHCIECHDPDGRGESGRVAMRRIPDFTDPKWHIARNDRELARSVLDGRGSMPSWKAKLSGTDVERLVVLVRNFRGGAQRVPEDDDTAARSEEPAAKSEETPAPPPRSSQPAQRSADSSAGSRTAASDTPATGGREVFSRLCVACHGKDGQSQALRARIPWAPNFTSPEWHKLKDEGRLVMSVLEGRGYEMPAFRERISGPEAREVVHFLRSLAGLRNEPSLPLAPAFDREFQRLMNELNDVKQTYHSLDPGPAAR